MNPLAPLTRTLAPGLTVGILQGLEQVSGASISKFYYIRGDQTTKILKFRLVKKWPKKWVTMIDNDSELEGLLYVSRLSWSAQMINVLARRKGDVLRLQVAWININNSSTIIVARVYISSTRWAPPWHQFPVSSFLVTPRPPQSLGHICGRKITASDEYLVRPLIDTHFQCISLYSVHCPKYLLANWSNWSHSCYTFPQRPCHTPTSSSDDPLQCRW